MRKIKLKKPEYVPFQKNVDITLPCDSAYDRTLTTFKHSKEALATCVYKCLIATARVLADACRRFERDPNLSQLQAGLRRGVAPSDLIEIGSALRQFLSTVDTREVDFGEGSAEGHLVFAAQSLLRAVESSSSDDHEDAYADTVRCRSSLAQLER